MKTTQILLAALFSLGVSGAAVAQSTSGSVPAPSSAPRPESVNDTNPMTPAAPADRVATMKDGANISNNRDRLSPGTGTPPSMAIDRRLEQANEDADKRSRKGKVKNKSPR